MYIMETCEPYFYYTNEPSIFIIQLKDHHCEESWMDEEKQSGKTVMNFFKNDGSHSSHGNGTPKDLRNDLNKFMFGYIAGSSQDLTKTKS